MSGRIQNQEVLPGGLQSQPDKTALAPKSPVNPGRRKSAPVIANASFTVIEGRIDDISEKVIDSDNRRAFIQIDNPNVGQSIFVNFDTQASNSSMEIPGGGSWAPSVAPVNSIHIKGSVANLRYTLTQGLKRD